MAALPVLLPLGIVAQVQVIDTAGAGEKVRDLPVKSWIRMLNENDIALSARLKKLDMKIFNVVAYGADPTGAENSADDFREAIREAAMADGTVYAPAGTYLFTDSVVLKAGVKLEMRDATVAVPDGYDGSMFYWGRSNGNLVGAGISGGRYRGEGYRWTCVKLESSHSTRNYAMLNTFEGMYIEKAKVGFDLRTTGSGWINANYYSNNTLWQCVSAIRTREPSGLGIDGHMFTNTNIQAGSHTRIGIDSLSGQSNQFYGLNFYDFPSYGSAVTCVLASSSSDNHLFGKSIGAQHFRDHGISNLVITDGQVLPWQKTLSNNTIESVLYLPFGPGDAAGGEISYTLVVKSEAGDSMQVRTGRISFSAILTPGGRFISSIDAKADGAVYVESHQALKLNEEWQIQDVTGPADFIRVRVRFVTNIGVPEMKLYYHLVNNSQIVGYY